MLEHSTGVSEVVGSIFLPGTKKPSNGHYINGMPRETVDIFHNNFSIQSEKAKETLV